MSEIYRRREAWGYSASSDENPLTVEEMRLEFERYFNARCITSYLVTEENRQRSIEVYRFTNDYPSPSEYVRQISVFLAMATTLGYRFPLPSVNSPAKRGLFESKKEEHLFIIECDLPLTQ